MNTVNPIARVEGVLRKSILLTARSSRPAICCSRFQQDQYKAQLTQAQAQQLRTAEGGVRYAQAEVDRYSALVKQGAASQVVVDNWNFNLVKAQSDVAAAKAQVDIATSISPTPRCARRSTVSWAGILSMSEIRSAVRGREPCSPKSCSWIPSMSSPTSANRKCSRVRQNLGDRRLTQSDLKDVPVEIDWRRAGLFRPRRCFDYVAPGIDPKTGTLLVRGIPNNRGRTLLPGFFVRMRLPQGRTLPTRCSCQTARSSRTRGSSCWWQRGQCRRAAISGNSVNCRAACASCCRA